MNEQQKTPAEKLAEQLLLKNKNGWFRVSPEEEAEIFRFAEGYRAFLDASKTEREAVKSTLAAAEAKGFVPFSPSARLKAGDKVYVNNRGKAVLLAKIGRRPVSEGVRIVAAHIDSPRLDFKPNPLYEDSELAYIKTHYYGGIKKYQWPTVPLALHGVVVRGDGSTVDIRIGEDPGDPQFVVNDLLPHLATEQVKRPMNEAIAGEDLNILVGSRPFADDKASEAVKLHIMKLLNEKYGIVEGDFISAELEAVPACHAVDIGFDRSMVGGYGHDDRVCAYPAFMSLLESGTPEYTAVCVLADKEEIGSEGNTGLQSSYLKDFIYALGRLNGVDGYDVLSRSMCLSADVNAGFDPNFPSVYEKRNSCLVNYGVVITKYTGSRGKSGTSDASAEYMGYIRRLLNSAGVVWQTGSLGAVDKGGGGTVAMYIANMNVDTVDLGVPVLSMHAPFETISKLDLYMAYRAFCEFIK